MTWDPATPGILRLPSGRLIRGRGVQRPVPEGPEPAFGVYLLDEQPPAVAWESRWVHWPDFGLAADPVDMARALTEVWTRAATERVEVACLGGNGRTGTALACIAILDGVPNEGAVAYIRAHYRPHAVETVAQAEFVSRFQPR